MIRHNLNPILKRSLQARRCMFQQQQQQQRQPPQASQGTRLPSFPSSVTVRVSSKSTATAASGSARGTRLVTPSATPGGWSVRQLLQRRLPTVVRQDAIRDALPFIGNGAYMALASGFLMTDMLQLRLMLVGGYAGLVTFHSLHAKPLLIPLRWSALFVVVNAGAAMMLFIDQWIGALLTDEEMDLYEQNFKTGLTPGQFYHLLKMAQTTEIADGSVLTKEGQHSPNLYFIEKGQAKVYHRGTFASHVDQGGFVNDVAFQRTQTVHGDNNLPSENDNNNSNEQVQPRGVGAYGTVVANGDCKVWVWDQAELKEFLKNRPDMDRNMKYTLSQHLVRSLLKQREVRRLASTEEQEVLEKTELTMPERRDFRRVKTSSWP